MDWTRRFDRPIGIDSADNDVIGKWLSLKRLPRTAQAVRNALSALRSPDPALTEPVDRGEVAIEERAEGCRISLRRPHQCCAVLRCNRHHLCLTHQAPWSSTSRGSSLSYLESTDQTPLLSPLAGR